MIDDDEFIIEYNEILNRCHCVRYKDSMIKKGYDDWILVK